MYSLVIKPEIPEQDTTLGYGVGCHTDSKILHVAFVRHHGCKHYLTVESVYSNCDVATMGASDLDTHLSLGKGLTLQASSKNLTTST